MHQNRHGALRVKQVNGTLLKPDEGPVLDTSDKDRTPRYGAQETNKKLCTLIAN